MQGQGQFPELVTARLRQLLAVAVPSVLHQTNQCFVWVLLTDPKLPAAPRRSVAAALRAHPHARLVNYPVRTIREAPNATLFEEVFGAASWRRAMRNAGELTLVRLDADDGLHVHYLQLLADWRARHRGELSAASTYAYACSSRSLDWKSASAKEWVASAPGETKRPRGVQLNVFYEGHGRGCLASGLAMTHVVLDGMIPPCFPKPCTANHASLRAQRFPVKNIVSVANGPVGWSAPPPVFRVRSVTSNGGSNRQGGRADVPPAAVAASYGLDLLDLLTLTRYLERHEAAVATEMLKSPAARGCNSQYSGSCDRASAAHWARDVINRHSNIPRRYVNSSDLLCYARRHPDLLRELCHGDARRCDLVPLRKHYDRIGQREGRRFGCWNVSQAVVQPNTTVANDSVLPSGVAWPPTPPVPHEPPSTPPSPEPFVVPEVDRALPWLLGAILGCLYLYQRSLTARLLQEIQALRGS